MCLAISVAPSTAKLTVAVAIAGASFTPSPTIATFLPCCCRLSIFCALSRGDSSPKAWFALTCWAIKSTTDCLSPLITITSRWWACSDAITLTLSGLSSSASAKAATGVSLILTATWLAICQTGLAWIIAAGNWRLAKLGVPIFTRPIVATCACIPCPSTVSTWLMVNAAGLWGVSVCLL